MARWLLIGLLVLLVAGCGPRTRGDWDGSAGGSMAEVTIVRDRGAVELAIWEGAILYDLRDYQDWLQGNISGARRITLDDVERGRALPMNRDAPLLFFGDGPRDIRPELAAEMALQRGYSNVQLFPGGWRAWAGMHALAD